MFGKRAWIWGIVGAVAVAAVAWNHRAADPGTWPQYEYFRCLSCGGPALIDPSQPERWGCRVCDFSTFQITRRFRTAVRNDFRGGEDELVDAALQAGCVKASDAKYLTPVAIWSQGGE